MKIIYKKDNGCSVLTPAPKFLAALPPEWSEEEKMVHLANKDLTTGTPYEILEDVPSDRVFRSAWEYVAGDNEKTSNDLDEKFMTKYNKKGASNAD